jgi:hypothetical protein
MTEINFIEAQIKAFVETRRPPEEARSQVDVGYTFDNNLIEILEIRPQWNDASIINKIPLAKANYIKSKKVWKIYWIDANLKWLSYKPNPEVRTVLEFLKVLEEDSHNCFWG